MAFQAPRYATRERWTFPLGRATEVEGLTYDNLTFTKAANAVGNDIDYR